MRIRPQKNNLKYIIILGVCIVLIALIGIYIATNKASNNKVTPPTSNETIILSDEQKVTAEHQDPAATQTGVDGVKTNDGSAAAGAFPTTQPNLKISIQSVQQSDGSIVVENKISPSIQSGECSLRITRNGEYLAQKSFETSGESCKNASIATEGISKGDVSVTIFVQVGSNVANSTQAFTVK